MPGSIKDIGSISDLIDGLKAVESKSVFVGILGNVDSEFIKIAAANEFGAVIKPKKGKFLTIPLVPEAKGKSPRSFGDLKLIRKKGSKGEAGGILARVNGTNIEPIFALVKQVIIPERSFMRETFENTAVIDAIREEARYGIEDYFAGKIEAIQILHRIGQRMVSEIRNRIVDNDPALAPNSPLTLKLKSGSGPLRDSLRLFQAISYSIDGEIFT
jgi:hypothetical protein